MYVVVIAISKKYSFVTLVWGVGSPPPNCDTGLPLQCAVQEATGATPFSLMFRWEVQLPVHIMFGMPPGYSQPASPTEYAQNLQEQLHQAYISSESMPVPSNTVKKISVTDMLDLPNLNEISAGECARE